MFELLVAWLIYTGYFREYQYGLANQNFAQWLSDQAIGIVVSIVVISLFIAVIYAVVRNGRNAKRQV